MRGKITVGDVTLLVLLASFWGSAFLFIKVAVAEIPPMSLAAGRVALGAVILYGVLRLRGQRLPLRLRLWGRAALVGLSGTVMPFFLIGWGQQSVDSALTAICMATVPLFTLPLAHFLTHDERLSAAKIIGVVIGFSGVVLLTLEGSGQSAGSPANATFAGLVAILTAAFGYALSGIIIHRLPDKDPLVTGTMILTSGAVILLILAIMTDAPWTLRPGRDALLSLIVIGVFPTALATIILIRLIARAGATFVSLNNYLVPVVGIACGVIWLDETVGLVALLAFALILAGVFLTGRRKHTCPKDQS